MDKYILGRVIVVGDRGMITGDNIAQILTDRNGYVLSFSIRGSEKAFKEYVLDESDYRRREDDPEGFRIKSRQANRRIHVTNPFTGKKKDFYVEEKHIVFYSPEYAAKAKNDRQRTLEKAKDLISHPEKYSRATGYGAAKYVKNVAFDRSTGEIIQKKGTDLSLDMDLIKEEEMYDGYYAIVTSEYKDRPGDHRYLPGIVGDRGKLRDHEERTENKAGVREDDRTREGPLPDLLCIPGAHEADGIQDRKEICRPDDHRIFKEMRVLADGQECLSL